MHRDQKAFSQCPPWLNLQRNLLSLLAYYTSTTTKRPGTVIATPARTSYIHALSRPPPCLPAPQGSYLSIQSARFDHHRQAQVVLIVVRVVLGCHQSPNGRVCVFFFFSFHVQPTTTNYPWSGYITPISSPLFCHHHHSQCATLLLRSAICSLSVGFLANSRGPKTFFIFP